MPDLPQCLSQGNHRPSEEYGGEEQFYQAHHLDASHDQEIRGNIAVSLKVQKLIADYEKFVTEMESEADLYARQKEAEGIKLTKDAEARGEALKRAALATAGGDTLVALRIVENLKLGDLMISTQLVNPLDIDAMMRRLGATAK